MKFTWLPERGPLNGAFLFLSASVPDPKRHPRFLEGPADAGLMLRVIDRRVDDAVQSLLSQTLNAGGRIVHGGHPKIMLPIAHQANQWKIPAGIEAPIRIYQSEYFRNQKPPMGRAEIEQTGAGVVRWVSANLSEVAARRKIPTALLTHHLPLQAPPEADAERREALLAMRIEMLIDSQPTSAVCIGGMEGIEAEAHLYLELAKAGLIPPADEVHVMGSTFGAAAQLQGGGMRYADLEYFHHAPKRDVPADFHLFKSFAADAVPEEESPDLPASPSKPAFTSTPETAQRDLQNRVSYDGVMRSLIENLASKNK